MNCAIKDATIKRFYYETHDELQSHLADFISAYNFAEHLKTLKGLNTRFCLHFWFIAAGTSEATARSGRRHTVRTDCLLQAVQRFPAVTAGAKMKSKRNASYKACMAAAGRRP